MNYKTIIENYSNLSKNSDSPIKIITNDDQIQSWQEVKRNELIKKGKPIEWAEIGIILDDPYIVVVRDLVKFPGEYLGGYFRILNKADLQGGNGVVIIPEYNGKILLLRQFRHPIRDWSYEFPRGFGEPNILAENQARVEIQEEVEGEISDLVDLGSYFSNTGLEGNKVNLFLAKLIKVGQPALAEGIKDILWVSVSELESMIANNQINDGFTISAYTRAKLKGYL